MANVEHVIQHIRYIPYIYNSGTSGQRGEPSTSRLTNFNLDYANGVYGIGSYITAMASITFLTKIPSISSIPALSIVMKAGMFIDKPNLSSIVEPLPVEPLYFFEVNPSKKIRYNVGYKMGFKGPITNDTHDFYIKFIFENNNTKVYIYSTIILLADNNSFNPTIESNYKKFTYNSQENTTSLNNSVSNSLYNSGSKYLEMKTWIMTDPLKDIATVVKLKGAEKSATLKGQFYFPNVNPIHPTIPKLISDSRVSLDYTVISTDLNTNDFEYGVKFFIQSNDTVINSAKLIFQFDQKVYNCKVIATLIKTDSINEQSDILKTINPIARYIDKNTTTTSDEDITKVPAFVEGASLERDVIRGVKFEVNDSNTRVIATCTIDASNFKTSDAFALVGVCYFERNNNPPPHAEYYSASIILPDIKVLPAKLPVCPPVVGGYITDYIRNLGNKCIVSPQERLKFVNVWHLDKYNSCRIDYNHIASDLISICNCYITYETATHTQLVALYSANRIANNNTVTFTSKSSDYTVTYDKIANTLTTELVLRIRYEHKTNNILTTDKSGAIVIDIPSGNQDWTDKEFKVKHQLILNYKKPYDGADVYNNIQLFKVHNYDRDCLKAKFYDDENNEIKVLCNTTQKVKVVVTSCNDDVLDGDENEKDYWIAGIDKETYSIDHFKEYEAFDSGIIKQLTDSPLETKDKTFGAKDGGQTVTYIDVSNITISDQYRFVAIKKKGHIEETFPPPPPPEPEKKKGCGMEIDSTFWNSVDENGRKYHKPDYGETFNNWPTDGFGSPLNIYYNSSWDLTHPRGSNNTYDVVRSRNVPGYSGTKGVDDGRCDFLKDVVVPNPVIPENTKIGHPCDMLYYDPITRTTKVIKVVLPADIPCPKTPPLTPKEPLTKECDVIVGYDSDTNPIRSIMIVNVNDPCPNDTTLPTPVIPEIKHIICDVITGYDADGAPIKSSVIVPEGTPCPADVVLPPPPPKDVECKYISGYDGNDQPVYSIKIVKEGVPCPPNATLPPKPIPTKECIWITYNSDRQPVENRKTVLTTEPCPENEILAPESHECVWVTYDGCTPTEHRETRLKSVKCPESTPTPNQKCRYIDRYDENNNPIYVETTIPCGQICPQDAKNSNKRCQYISGCDSLGQPIFKIRYVPEGTPCPENVKCVSKLLLSCDNNINDTITESLYNVTQIKYYSIPYGLKDRVSAGAIRDGIDNSLSMVVMCTYEEPDGMRIMQDNNVIFAVKNSKDTNEWYDKSLDKNRAPFDNWDVSKNGLLPSLLSGHIVTAFKDNTYTYNGDPVLKPVLDILTTSNDSGSSFSLSVYCTVPIHTTVSLNITGAVTASGSGLNASRYQVKRIIGNPPLRGLLTPDKTRSKTDSGKLTLDYSPTEVISQDVNSCYNEVHEYVAIFCSKDLQNSEYIQQRNNLQIRFEDVYDYAFDVNGKSTSSWTGNARGIPFPVISVRLYGSNLNSEYVKGTRPYNTAIYEKILTTSDFTERKQNPNPLFKNLTAEQQQRCFYTLEIPRAVYDDHVFVFIVIHINCPGIRRLNEDDATKDQRKYVYSDAEFKDYYYDSRASFTGTAGLERVYIGPPFGYAPIAAEAAKYPY